MKIPAGFFELDRCLSNHQHYALWLVEVKKLSSAEALEAIRKLREASSTTEFRRAIVEDKCNMP